MITASGMNFWNSVLTEAVVRTCSVKVFFEISQNSQENTCQDLFCNKISGLRPPILFTLTQVFSWEFCKFFENTFFYRTLPVAASVLRLDELIT